MAKYFVIGMFVIMAAAGIFVAFSMGIAPLLTSPTTPRLAKTVEAPKSGKNYESYKVGKWSGQGIKSTETFHISSDVWMIYWSSRPLYSAGGVFQIYVHRSDGTLVDVAANIIGKSQDNTVMRTGPGDYYLKINSANVGYGIVAVAVREVQ